MSWAYVASPRYRLVWEKDCVLAAYSGAELRRRGTVDLVCRVGCASAAAPAAKAVVKTVAVSRGR